MNMKREWEEKVKKIFDYKERLRLIADRAENYHPKVEKNLLNQYLEFKGNIRVFVRVRPLLSQDFKAYSGSTESFEAL